MSGGPGLTEDSMNRDAPRVSEIYTPLQKVFQESSLNTQPKVPRSALEAPQVSAKPGMWETSYIHKFMKNKPI